MILRVQAILAVAKVYGLDRMDLVTRRLFWN
jgi:hypothetical protein